MVEWDKLMDVSAAWNNIETMDDNPAVRGASEIESSGEFR